MGIKEINRDYAMINSRIKCLLYDPHIKERNITTYEFYMIFAFLSFFLWLKKIQKTKIL